MTKMPRWLVALALVALIASGCAPFVTPTTPRETPGTWTEYPNTKLREAKKADGTTPLLADLPHGGETDIATAVISAWVSGAYEPGANRLLMVRHGGHADTAHNGVLALSLTGTPTWAEVKAPSLAYPPISGPGPWLAIYPDGSPSSLHTYDCEAWLPTVNAVYSGGGIYWSPGGESVPQQVFWWTPATNAYTKKAVRPGGYGCATVWDAVTERLLLRTSGNLYAYDPTTDTYASLFAKSASTSTGSTLWIDTPGRKVYRIEQNASLSVIDLTAKTETALAHEGDADIQTLAGVGGAFVDGKIVAYGRTADKERGALYTMAVGACGLAAQPKCRWVRHDPPSGPTPPKPTVQGTWKRAFVANGKFYVVPSATENVWAFTLATPPPGLTYPLTVTATGPGTVSGGGAFAADVPVTLTATPTGSATFTGWTPAPCAPTFAMPAQALECAGTFAATPPPVVVPPPTTSISGPDAQGRYIVTITQPDGKGNVTTTDVRTLAAVTTPPPPVVKHSLSITTAGTGQGTTTGAGSYDAGAVVTMTGTPAAGSTGPVWSGDTDCHDGAVTMTGARACIATFTLSTTPPPSGQLVPRTWTAVPAKMIDPATNTEKTAVFLGSKHTRLAFDSKRRRMLLGGGDYSTADNSNGSYSGNYVWAFDVATRAPWVQLHAWCPPTAPAIMPAGADDITWAYDPKRDVAVAMPAYFGGVVGRACPNVTQEKTGYGFDLTTNRWIAATWTHPPDGYGGDLHNHFGVLDPVTDTVYRFFTQGGVTMQVIPLDGRAPERVTLTGYCDSGKTCDLSNDMMALDVDGRAIYAINRAVRALLKYSIPNKTVTRIPLPSQWVQPTSEYGGYNYETLLGFDSVNRVLFLPNILSYGGTLTSGVGLYWVDENRWEWETAPANVSGNALGFDPVNNAFLFLGRNDAKNFWLYRIAEPSTVDRAGDHHFGRDGRLIRGPRPDDGPVRVPRKVTPPTKKK